MSKLIICKILFAGFILSFVNSLNVSAYTTIGCTADTASDDDAIHFDCRIDINDPVVVPNVDELRVTHQVSGYWQQCWDDSTNQYGTTGLLSIDDDYPLLEPPGYTQVINNVGIAIGADKKYGPNPSILLHYTPTINSNGKFYYHSISPSQWVEYVPNPDTRVHSFDWEPTPCN